MTYDENNIFAKILRGDIPNKTVYEDAHVLSFHDIAPIAPIHVLVIPKAPYIDFSDFHQNADKQTIIQFYQGVEQTIQKLKLLNGYRIVSNKGQDGGQEVPHFHIHILSGTKLSTENMFKKFH
ncbi:MAG TPA: histidine triad nucleotide-binding protein [Holosporales bacterium]|nr:histidine triad nucleotide-binding protein [Holosporales bacterium]